jgi:hypothetical protein
MVEKENFLLSSFQKVTKQIQLDGDEMLKVSNSFEFLTLKSVKISEAPIFAKDLEKLLDKLDDGIARMYRYDSETYVNSSSPRKYFSYPLFYFFNLQVRFMRISSED